MNKLWPHEQAGRDWLLKHPRGLLADPPGYGKTIQSLAAAASTLQGSTLIVCPNSVKPNWGREIARWIPAAKFWIMRAGGPPPPFDLDFLVINYELLDKVKARRWRTVIFDEATYLKSSAAKRTRLAQDIGDRAERVWLLTGTPIMNRPVELVSLLKLIHKLEDFGGYWYFVNRYCQAHKRMVRVRGRFGRSMLRSFIDVSGADNLEELFALLKHKEIMLRREVALGLPEQRSIKVALELPAGELREYNRAAQDFRSWCAANLRGRKIDELGQDAATRALRAEALTKQQYLQGVAAWAKREPLIQWLERLVGAGEKVVVFAKARALQKHLVAHYGRSCAHLLADDTEASRQTNLDRFAKDPACQVFIASTGAAAMGLNDLVVARYCVFADMMWNPKIHEQAIARLHRPGQTREVTAYYLVADGTIEDQIADTLLSKHEVTSIVMDGKVSEKLIDQEMTA